MAKRGKSEDDPYGMNEVDDFADKREKVLLNDSTLAYRQSSDEEDLMDEEEEEVMAMSGDEEDEELDGAEAYRKVFGRNLETEVPDEEDEEGMLDNENAWGATKNEYYGADDLDDQETAKEIEKEALRQQKKHLAELNMEDYYDDVVDEEWSKDAKEFDMKEFKASTKQADAEIAIKSILNMDDSEKRQHLNTLFPEFIPLTRELKTLTEVHDGLKEHSKSEVNKLKLIALCSYLSTLSSYFAIFLHELHNNEEFATMKDHPVMEAILTSKEIWRQASELPAEDTLEDDEDMVDSDVVTLVERDADITTPETDDESENSNDESKKFKNGGESEQEKDSEVDIDDFEEYVKQSRVTKKNNNASNDIDGIATDATSYEIEENADFIEDKIADIDAEDKRKRKKSLRFYTSKIDQQEMKKAEKFTGDEDIPYKERLFERQQRLLEEARKRGLHAPKSADLDNEEFGSDDEQTSKTINDKSSAEYYRQILQGKKDKKEGRKKAHFDALIAARDGKLNELSEEIGEDGKRAINYQILKNKGLTPKRKKDNRNSRVKKRKKYEKAQKKLKSVRAVYSGGQNGPYEGEKTGIKKNLTRSVKFKS